MFPPPQPWPSPGPNPIGGLLGVNLKILYGGPCDQSVLCLVLLCSKGMWSTLIIACLKLCIACVQASMLICVCACMRAMHPLPTPLQQWAQACMHVPLWQEPNLLCGSVPNVVCMYYIHCPLDSFSYRQRTINVVLHVTIMARKHCTSSKALAL